MTTDFYPVQVPLAQKPLGLMKSLAAARENVLLVIPEIAKRQPMISGWSGVTWHMIMDPGAVKHVLLDHVDDYPKSDVTKLLLQPVIGHSLFNADGAHWRWQRRASAPVFAARNVQALSPVMSMAAQRCIDRVKQNCDTQAINIFDEMVTATFEVISQVTFSDDDGFDQQPVHDAINSYLSKAAKVSLLDFLGAPEWIPRPSRMFLGGSIKRMKQNADKLINNRKKRPQNNTPDLLDLLVAAKDDTTQREMTTAEIRDNLLAFIVAGHETTALTLSWALYLLSNDPTTQEKARSEALNHLGDRIATADDIANFPYIRAIIDETLRLYPPAGLISRTALKNDDLCGRDIKAGDTIMLPIYAMHRSYMLWDEPDAFRAERFLGGCPVDRWGYIPFGDGPRICIGANFALQEAIIILASLLAKYRFTPISGKSPKPAMILTLRPEGGVWLNCEEIK